MHELLKLQSIGLKGLSTDVTPWELPPEYLTFGVNFRVFSGSILTAGGSKLWSQAPVNFHPGFLMHSGAVSGDYWLVPGREAVYVFDGNTWTDIGSTEGYAGLGPDDELLWSGCKMGQIPIISNPQAQPEYWAPQSPGQPLQALPFDQSSTWSEKSYSAKLFRSHKTVMLALNLHEGADDFPDSFRWSHPADINGLPATWDETDDAFLAGKAALGGDGGQIIDGASLRDGFCIYSENAIDILDSTNDEFVWRRRELSSTVGLLSRNCIIEVKGVHYFLADGDIVVNDGTNISSIAHGRIRKQLTARINVDKYDRSFAVRNNSLKEIWFCVVEEDADYPNIAYIYNWKEDSWAIRDLPENMSYAGYGSQATPSNTWDDYIDADVWNGQKQTWGASELTPLDDTIIGTNPVNSSLHLLDPSDTPDDDIKARIERTDFPLVDMRQVTTIVRLYPHIDGTQPVNIQIGSQDKAGGSIRWKPKKQFIPGQDRKIDMRTTGELHCWRVESIGKGSWTMSGMDIEFERSGFR